MKENTVLYRKYRPNTFSRVKGQEHITTTLKNALNRGKVAHAYLFSGPKGTGKTTVARILARAINCHKATGGEPCNACKNCREVLDSASLDIIEIDGASNRGIEEIRDLREGIKFSPTSLSYKVFIIDEVHMLTTPAFNALLKTLEEPPAHALFILATTEPHKVLATITSRCQRFDFKKLAIGEMVNLLKETAKQEKINLNDQALKLLAVVAEGDMRDAYSLLDQLLATGDRHITLEKTQRILGVSDIQALVKMADLLAKQDSALALKLIEKLSQSGADIAYYQNALVDYFKKMLTLLVDPDLRELATPELTDLEYKTILTQAKKFGQQRILTVLEALLKAKQRMRFSPSRELPLLMAVVEVCQREKLFRK